MIPLVGVPLHPDPAYLDILGGILERDAEIYEVAPETTWIAEGNRLVPNGFHQLFRDLGTRNRRPFIAHGVGFSIASASPEPQRRKAWLGRLARDMRAFRYRWYTDHFGATTLDGCSVTLPLGPPQTPYVARRMRASLRAMQTVARDVGVETTAQMMMLGAPLSEPAFLASALPPRAHLLLDLHNIFTMGQNMNFDPLAYVAGLPLDRVIEIHLSGGSNTDVGWLPNGRQKRLDSHDAAVPEEVWKLFETVFPHCPKVRAVVIERMEGTVERSDVKLLRSELTRAKRLVKQPGKRVALPSAPTPAPLAALDAAGHRALEAALLNLLTGAPRAAPRVRLSPVAKKMLRDINDDDLRVCKLLIAKLRFERLMRGSEVANQWFSEDPRSFSRAFARYHAEVRPTAFFPPAEAQLFSDWLPSCKHRPS